MKITLKTGITMLLGGIIFGLGLSISNMINPDVVISFLELQDFGLLLVLCSAVVISAIGYYLIPKLFRTPLIAKHFQKHTKVLSKQTVIGAVIFGIGWGISGLCPGAVIAALGTLHWKILLGFAAMLLGVYVEGRFFES